MSFFGESGVAYERNCEGAPEGCNTDMRSFKGYLHRWMATTMKLVPHTEAVIMPVMRSSARAALKTCVGGANGRMCGFHWRAGEFRAPAPGAGEQMNVLGALLSVMKVNSVKAPLSGNNGGTSQGDSNAGLGGTFNPYEKYGPPTAADKAGASIATVVFVGVFAGLMGWLNWDQLMGRGALPFPGSKA